MFILTALQYWATQYASVVLKGDPATVHITFSATVITAPCLGAIVGGAVTTKYLGSYTNRKALTLCFIVYLLFVAFCIPCPLMNNYTYFIILMWLAIFMQGFIEPIMMGIILNTVTPLERPTASSLSILLEMLFGMLPAPYVYGLVYEKTEKLDLDGNNISRGGMYALFFSSGIGGVALLITLILRNRSYKKGLERIKNSLRMSNPNISAEQLDDMIGGEPREAGNMDNSQHNFVHLSGFDGGERQQN
jgi:MFS family permease